MIPEQSALFCGERTSVSIMDRGLSLQSLDHPPNSSAELPLINNARSAQESRTECYFCVVAKFLVSKITVAFCITQQGKKMIQGPFRIEIMVFFPQEVYYYCESTLFYSKRPFWLQQELF